MRSFKRRVNNWLMIEFFVSMCRGVFTNISRYILCLYNHVWLLLIVIGVSYLVFYWIHGEYVPRSLVKLHTENNKAVTFED